MVAKTNNGIDMERNYVMYYGVTAINTVHTDIRSAVA